MTDAWCTEESCPKMTAGKGYRFAWKDGVRYKKPKELSAPEYIFEMMDWVDAKIQVVHTCNVACN